MNDDTYVFTCTSTSERDILILHAFSYSRQDPVRLQRFSQRRFCELLLCNELYPCVVLYWDKKDKDPTPLLIPCMRSLTCVCR